MIAPMRWLLTLPQQMTCDVPVCDIRIRIDVRTIRNKGGGRGGLGRAMAPPGFYNFIPPSCIFL